LFYELTNESLAAAEKIFRRALASAPKSCEAHWLLAGALIHRVAMGYVSDKNAIISEAFEIAKRAVSLDENHEYAHLFLGLIQFYREKHDLAIAELNRAIELNPNCSAAYGVLGDFLIRSDPDESIKNLEVAIRTNPKDPTIFFRYSALAAAHFAAGRYLEASQWARKSVQRKPSWRGGHAWLTASLAQLNLLEDAKEAANNYLENFPDETISYLLKLWNLEISDYAHRLEEGLRKAGLPE
jgi:tetratricopeptide (TPR) repeat protein